MRLAHAAALRVVAATLALASLTRAGSAATYTVEPGQDWALLGPKLVAGDVIVLQPGVHRAAAFTGVSGSPLLPIVIRSSGPRVLAEIAAEREAIKLTDCSHIHIERIVTRNPRRAGILLESTTPLGSRDIAISDFLVIGVRGLAEESGIIAREVADLGIRRSRIENCVGSGIHVENCESVSIRDVQVSAAPDKPMKCGIAFEGHVASALVESVQWIGPIDSALSIGTVAVARVGTSAAPDAPNAKNAQPATPPTLSPLVRFLTVTGSRCSGAKRFLDIGSCADSSVRNCTVRDPHEEVYRIAVPPTGHAAASLSFRENIIAWNPGVLRRLGFVAAGAEPKGVILGQNLWWSRELPLALGLLGPEGAPFPGTLEVPQRLDLDPKLDERGFATAEDAALVGAQRI